MPHVRFGHDTWVLCILQFRIYPSKVEAHHNNILLVAVLLVVEKTVPAWSIRKEIRIEARYCWLAPEGDF